VDFYELLSKSDGIIGVVIAVWVIQNGLVRLDNMFVSYREFVAQVLAQQQTNNQQLADLVKDLCTNVRAK
jgi:hypothetical protein